MDHLQRTVQLANCRCFCLKMKLHLGPSAVITPSHQIHPFVFSQWGQYWLSHGNPPKSTKTQRRRHHNQGYCLSVVCFEIKDDGVFSQRIQGVPKNNPPALYNVANGNIPWGWLLCSKHLGTINTLLETWASSSGIVTGADLQGSRGAWRRAGSWHLVVWC